MKVKSSQQYYIWSREKSTPEEMFFWTPWGKSTTKFLEDAGVFSKDAAKYHLLKVLTTKKQATYAKKLSKYAHENFLIPVDKIEILGIKKTSIIPY